MGSWWLLLLLVPALLLALYRTGLLSVQIAAVSAGWNWGLTRWWRGSYALLSGRLIRWFYSGKSSALRISIAGEAGSVCLEVADRSGAVRYAWYGVTALETRADVRGMERFSVRLRGEKFQGSFAFALEE